MKALAAFKVPQPRLPISRQGNTVHAWENILLQTCKVVKKLRTKTTQDMTCSWEAEIVGVGWMGT